MSGFAINVDMKQKTITQLKKKLWELVRERVRETYGNTCYTCGKSNLIGSNRQVGHFIPKSICSTELAYDLDNLRIQCFACNIHKSGNWIEYEAHLMIEKGRTFPDKLKKRNQKTKGKQYGRWWYEGEIKKYQK